MSSTAADTLTILKLHDLLTKFTSLKVHNERISQNNVDEANKENNQRITPEVS